MLSLIRSSKLVLSHIFFRLQCVLKLFCLRFKINLRDGKFPVFPYGFRNTLLDQSTLAYYKRYFIILFSIHMQDVPHIIVLYSTTIYTITVLLYILLQYCYIYYYSTITISILYLTISRRRRGDYKLIFIHQAAKRRGEYQLVITEPEATNCFSINFQVNIVSLSRKFCVYLYFTSLFTLWREHELRKRQSFCKI